MHFLLHTQAFVLADTVIPMDQWFLGLLCGVLVVAFLYSSVGHAGASGYIAVMSLVALSPTTIRPVALALNILVASIASWRFCRDGHFSWRLFWPFTISAVPLAFVGGSLSLPVTAFRFVVGIVLLFSSTWMVIRPPAESDVVQPPRLAIALGVGAALGLLSGLTGTGGGIFLTPLLLFFRWSPTRVAAGVSAVFILLNSVAGLLGALANSASIPTWTAPLAIVAVAGGVLGSHFGSRHFPQLLVKRMLAVVLLIAGLKLVLAH